MIINDWEGIQRPKFNNWDGKQNLFLPISITESQISAGNYKKAIIMRGLIPDGTPMLFIIRDVDIYIDVRPPCDEKINDIKFKAEAIKRISSCHGIDKYKIIKRYPFHGFTTEKVRYLRIFFDSFQARTASIRKILKTDLFTSNDNYEFAPIITRRFAFNTAKWNEYPEDAEIINNRIIVPFHKLKSPLRPLSDDDAPRIDGVSLSWDIESFQKAKGGPQVANTSTYSVKLIHMHFATIHNKKIIDVSLAVIPEKSVPAVSKHIRKDRITHLITCENEKQLITNFCHVLDRMKPEYEQGFNSGNYDWPCIYYKAQKYGLKSKLINSISLMSDMKMKFRNCKIKINAEKDHFIHLLPRGLGMQSSDVMPVFYKLYPKAEIGWGASLGFFLQRNKITGKDDMPFEKMNGIYRDTHEKPEIPQTLIRDFAKIIDYCAWDAGSLSMLYKKRNIYIDNIEKANMSYVSVDNAFYKADGPRVFNIIGYFAEHMFGTAFSEQYGERRKMSYPGAYVFPPIRGKKLVPIFALDFASLYPSIMKNENISPDRIVMKKEKAEELRKKGYKVKPLPKFKYTVNETEEYESEGYFVHHNGCYNIDDDRIIKHYKKIVSVKFTDGKDEVFQFEGPAMKTAVPDEHKIIDGRKVANRKVSYEPVYGRKPLPREHMGIMSFAVSKLLKERGPYKKQKVELEEIIEKMRKNGDVEYEYRGKNMTIEELEYLCTIINAKQLALKILANTFYGKMGETALRAYSVLVAGSITTHGQENIKMVANFLQDNNFTIHYGDTDSVYVSNEKRSKITNVPAKNAGDEVWREYYKQLVLDAQRDASLINEEITDLLIGYHGTRDMKMAYEEVLMPSVYCGKKKYYGIPHLNDVNFEPSMKSMFVRGIELIKKGGSALMRKVAEHFMLRSIDIKYRDESISDTLTKVLQEFYNNRSIYTLKDFVMSATYKPDKQQLAIHTFYDRMSVEGKTPPEAGNPFQYVIYKPKSYYNEVTGNKDTESAKRGHRMEYAKDCDINKIDFSWYMDHQIAGVLARFIASEEKFNTKAIENTDIDPNWTPDERYKALDKKSVKYAQSFVIEKFAKISGEDKLQEKIKEKMAEQKRECSAQKKKLKEHCEKKLIKCDKEIITVLQYLYKNNSAPKRTQLMQLMTDFSKQIVNNYGDTYPDWYKKLIVSFKYPKIPNKNWYNKLINSLQNNEFDETINMINSCIVLLSNYYKLK